MNWRKLSKAELIHIIEMENGDKEVIKMIVETRDAQKRMAQSSGNCKEVCRDCKLIAQKLGLES